MLETTRVMLDLIFKVASTMQLGPLIGCWFFFFFFSFFFFFFLNYLYAFERITVFFFSFFCLFVSETSRGRHATPYTIHYLVMASSKKTGSRQPDPISPIIHDLLAVSVFLANVVGDDAMAKCRGFHLPRKRNEDRKQLKKAKWKRR